MCRDNNCFEWPAFESWLQIVGKSTLSYLLLDTHESPGLHNVSPNLLKDLEFFEDLRNAIGVSIWQDLCTTGTPPITRFSYTAVFIRPKTAKKILSNSYFSEKREEYWNFCQKKFLSFFFLNVHFNISINCKIIILLSYVSFYSLLV